MLDTWKNDFNSSGHKAVPGKIFVIVSLSVLALHSIEFCPKGRSVDLYAEEFSVTVR